MVGIRAISCEIPAHRVDVAQRAHALGLDLETLQSRVGVRRIAKKAQRQEASDLCMGAARRLFEATPATPADVDCIVVVTQNPDGYGIPHTAAIVQAKLGLSESCASFDIGLGGSGYVYGLSLIKCFMESSSLKRGLLFTSDPYSRVVDEFDNQTALLFGDAATATLLTDDPIWDIGRCDFGTVGAQGHALQVRLKLGGRLYMNGMTISEFAKERGSHSLKRAILLNELTIEQIDRFIVHQGSREVVEGIAQDLDALGRTGFYAETYGDTVSSSIPIALAENIAPTDQRIALYGYGTGLSWASTVLTRVS